jgi:hypothetical protein
MQISGFAGVLVRSFSSFWEWGYLIALICEWVVLLSSLVSFLGGFLLRIKPGEPGPGDGWGPKEEPYRREVFEEILREDPSRWKGEHGEELSYEGKVDKLITELIEEIIKGLEKEEGE